MENKLNVKIEVLATKVSKKYLVTDVMFEVIDEHNAVSEITVKAIIHNLDIKASEIREIAKQKAIEFLKQVASSV